jgi:hypothetical protein
VQGPYDFIGQEQSTQGWGSSFNWAKQLRLSDVFANPLVIGADLLFNGLLYNPIAGPRALRGTMDAAQWAGFEARAAAKFRVGTATPEHLKSFVLKMNARDIGAGAGSHRAALGRGTFARDVAFQEALESNFGRRAARRINTARAMSGLSRFMLAYMAVDLGIGVMKSLAEAAGSYERPSRPNPTRSLETGGVSFDTRHAQTQRMRSIQAIHNTQLSTRAAMGNEAAFLHLA